MKLIQITTAGGNITACFVGGKKTKTGTKYDRFEMPITEQQFTQFLQGADYVLTMGCFDDMTAWQIYSFTQN